MTPSVYADRRLVERIRRQVGQSFDANPTRIVFWPEQFARGMGVELEQAKCAMLYLVQSEMFELEAVVRCPNGHTIWRGPVVELQQLAGERSRWNCGGEVFERDELLLRFDYRLAEWWRLDRGVDVGGFLS